MVLSNRSKRAWMEFENPYEMHRTIMKAFPEQIESDERVLFRIEGPTEQGIVVLVQSQHCPDWSGMGVSNNYLAEWPSTKEYDPHFESGEQYRFRLLANPTRKVKGKRLGEIGDDRAMDWLSRKSDSSGFKIEGVIPIERGFVRIRVGDRNMTLYSVLFEGVLSVSDPTLLEMAHEGGLGSGKGFGFGLLSLARG